MYIRAEEEISKIWAKEFVRAYIKAKLILALIWVMVIIALGMLTLIRLQIISICV